VVTGANGLCYPEVSKAAARVAEGCYNSLPAPKGRDEVAHLVESFNAMMGEALRSGTG